ncbi:MAG: hypothetical protein J0M04_16305 [Verrucomicrobia bacterium]|nr:hypothetical protein [Verrucomicrobiota bacterium]
MIRTSDFRHPLIQGITSYPRRRGRRPRPAALLLTFALGLLAGWLIRGGGAWPP